MHRAVQPNAAASAFDCSPELPAEPLIKIRPTRSAILPELRDMWRDRLALLHFEAFEVAYLDASRRLLPRGLKRLTEGTVARAAAYPRRIIERALRCEAAGMILAHNHTNGDVRPSQQDLTVTRSIVLSAELLDLSVHDHLIVSRRDVFSFREAGLL